jgi:hypothetical protein
MADEMGPAISLPRWIPLSSLPAGITALAAERDGVSGFSMTLDEPYNKHPREWVHSIFVPRTPWTRRADGPEDEDTIDLFAVLVTEYTRHEE